jgi:hypothetical protein
MSKKGILIALTIFLTVLGACGKKTTPISPTSPISPIIRETASPDITTPVTSTATHSMHRTAVIPPRPTHTPTRLPTRTPGPTTTPLPGSPLDYKTLSQGHIGLSTPPEERWPSSPTFLVFNSAEEWEQFVASYGLRAENVLTSEAFQTVSREVDFDDRLILIGLLYVSTTSLDTHHRVLGTWQDGETVYIRAGWEDVSDVALMAEGTWHILASISRPQSSPGQTLKFVFVSQWPPFDGVAEEIMTVERTLP